jgi:hypothetical protein
MRKSDEAAVDREKLIRFLPPDRFPVLGVSQHLIKLTDDGGSVAFLRFEEQL